MDTNKSAMTSGFSPTTHSATNKASHLRAPQSNKPSTMSSAQDSHSETDDTDHEDDQRTGGVSLLDHPDPSPAHSMYDASSTHGTNKTRKRNRRGAGRGGQGGVPSSIPEEPGQTFGHIVNKGKMPEGHATDQDDFHEDDKPLITPVMHRRAKATAHQGEGQTAFMAPRSQGFTPTRHGVAQRNNPTMTPSRFGGPLYDASDRGVFATPSAPRPARRDYQPTELVPYAQLAATAAGGDSSSVFAGGSGGAADVMYRVPAHGNRGAQTEPRRLYQHNLGGNSASPAPYETPTGAGNHHQSLVPATVDQHEMRRNMALVTVASTPAPSTALRVAPSSGFKIVGPPNKPLFQISGVPSEATMAVRSDLLNELTNTMTGLPTAETALSDRFFPFENFWESLPDNMNRGVIRIKNVPYQTTRAEVVAMLGRNTKILNDSDEGVHIIMERLNSKTNDIFVELMSVREVYKTVERFNDLARKRRFPRLGDRIVEIVESSQSELMREMFPTARGVKWNGTTPIIDPLAPQDSWRAFKDFINDEEFAMMHRFVESPMRAPFARDCPQRPYEFQISTLKKFPWHCPEVISFRQRWMLYYYTERLVEVLRATLDSPKHDQAVSPLTEQLLKRLHAACMLCPGFSAAQKNNISVTAGYDEEDMAGPSVPLMPMPQAGDELALVRADHFNRNEAVGKNHLPKNAFLWNHMHTVHPKAGVPFDVVEWYIATIREATIMNSSQLMDFDQQRIASEMEKQSESTGYFGRLWCELGMSSFPHDQLVQTNLRDLGERELAIIKRIIARALDPAAPFQGQLQVCA